MPAIVDSHPLDFGEPISVFESGAILIYLAEKAGRFLPTQVRGRKTVMEWLMWQMGGLGPMAGQNHHFVQYATEQVPYAIDRYVNETNRLYGVLNKRLEGRDWIADDYSIADMAVCPWVVNHRGQQQDIDDFPRLKHWFETMQNRPAVIRAYEKAAPWSNRPTVTETGKKLLFGQTTKRPRPVPDHSRKN